MLDPWIIEEIRRREREERQKREERPALEMPIRPPRQSEPGTRSGDQSGDRGVAIIDFSI